MNLRPEILTHPNIPKPLHGVAPRVLMGSKWWNEKRKEAYAKNNYCCWACGVHKSNAPRGWLEAHESYHIDYDIGRVELGEIVAVCRDCHEFIHSGRLFALWEQGRHGSVRVSRILHRGFRILKDNGLSPFFGTAVVYFIAVRGLPEEEAIFAAKEAGLKDIEVKAKWEDFYLDIEGQRYYSPFKDIEEWKEFYKPKTEQLQ